MRIVFSSPPLSGHLNPTIALARKLRDRGHDVFFVSLADAAATVRATGMEFWPIGEKDFPVGFTRKSQAELSVLTGLQGIRFSIARIGTAIDMIVRDLPVVLRHVNAQALVLDQFVFGAWIVAMHLELPYVHIANGLPLNQYSAVPMRYFGWPYRSGWLARLRNRVGNAAFNRFCAPVRSALARHCRTLNISIDLADPNAGFSRLAQIAQIPAEFDFPNPELPSWFHYAGPFQDMQARPTLDFPWSRLTGDPIIYASMGTLQTGLDHVYRAISEACSGLHCQLILSLGSDRDGSSVGVTDGNTITVPYAPQLEILRRAAVCITHAGLNTTLESLAQGVPLVAIPVTNDQPGVAARVAWTKTGTVVPLRRLTVARLRQSVRKVLEDSAYRESARRLQTAIQAANGLKRAADIIEQSFGVPKHISAVAPD